MRELVTRRSLRPRRLARDVPKALDLIAKRSLARHPEDRLATMVDLQRALDDYVVSATSDKARRKLPRAALAAAALLLVAVVVAAIYFARLSRPSLDERSRDLGARLPPGLEAEHAGHSYTLTLKPSGWVESEELAQAWGGHLVAINDQAEQEFLNRTYLAQRSDGKYPVCWIGLSAADRQSEYRWSTGETLTFKNWNPGEPTRGWNIERFVAANWHIANEIDRDGRVGDWNDVTGDARRLGIVELPLALATSPPRLSLRSLAGARIADLPVSGQRIPTAGRIVVEHAAGAPQLIDVMIHVE